MGLRLKEALDREQYLVWVRDSTKHASDDESHKQEEQEHHGCHKHRKEEHVLRDEAMRVEGEKEYAYSGPVDVVYQGPVSQFVVELRMVLVDIHVRSQLLERRKHDEQLNLLELHHSTERKRRRPA